MRQNSIPKLQSAGGLDHPLPQMLINRAPAPMLKYAALAEVLMEGTIASSLFRIFPSLTKSARSSGRNRYDE